jgi:hypothetical protein
MHGHCTRAEIEAAFGVLTTDTPWINSEGVLWRDLALGPALFHREILRTTTAAYPTGQPRRRAADGDSLAAGQGNFGGVFAGFGFGCVRWLYSVYPVSGNHGASTYAAIPPCNCAVARYYRQCAG